MNGIGILGTIYGLEIFLSKLEMILSPGGEFIFDSSNLIYLFSEDEKNWSGKKRKNITVK
ncbi:MAG: hypothetical protein KAS71_16060 [Bacteroidales bacterium]|nr:hypothetical protein [Bacteroidales bacterium]